jgi:leader peptidase (prepilin peptidase) / N-methyltransferase
VASLPYPLQLVLYLVTILAGLGVGMAVNVLADRVVGDEDPPWRAADCRKCGAPLPASRFLPVANLRAARRSCSACAQPASLRRPVLELALASLFPLLLAHAVAPESAARLAPWTIFAIDVSGCSILAFIFAVDLEHHLILDIAVYPAYAGLVLIALLFDHKALVGMLFGVALCGGLFLIFYLAGWLLYHQEALGFGDVKLAVLVGLLVGWPGVTTALVLAALFGAAVSVVLLGQGSATRHTFLPYGVFLALGAALALLVTMPFW